MNSQSTPAEEQLIQELFALYNKPTEEQQFETLALQEEAFHELLQELFYSLSKNKLRVYCQSLLSHAYVQEDLKQLQEELIELIATSLIERLASHPHSGAEYFYEYSSLILTHYWPVLWQNYMQVDFSRYLESRRSNLILYPISYGYSYSLRGICEPDLRGVYRSAEECLEANQDFIAPPHDELESKYIIYTYDPLSARYLAPSDQVAVIRRLTGVKIYSASNYEVLGWLARGNFLNLYYGGFQQFVLQRVTRLQVVYLELLQGASSFTVDWQALSERQLPTIFADSLAWNSSTLRANLIEQYSLEQLSDYDTFKRYLIYSECYYGPLSALLGARRLPGLDDDYYWSDLLQRYSSSWELLWEYYGPPEYFERLQERWYPDEVALSKEELFEEDILQREEREYLDGLLGEDEVEQKMVQGGFEKRGLGLLNEEEESEEE